MPPLHKLPRLRPMPMALNRTTPRYDMSDSSITIIANDLYPPFFEEIVKICKVPSVLLPKVDATFCLTSLVFPPLEEQKEAIDDLMELEKTVSIREIKPYLLYYMMTDKEIAKEFLLDYQKYLLLTDKLQDYLLNAIQSR